MIRYGNLRWMLLFLLLVEGNANSLFNSPILTADASYNSYKFNILHHLTAISPYFESDTNELNPGLPTGCTVDKVVYLIRHGSIYANDYDYEHTIDPFLKRFQSSLSQIDFSRSQEFAFLQSWNSPISDPNEQLEKLTKSGRLEAFHLGTQLAYRYPNIIPENFHASFKIWASSSNRTKESASSLLSGLSGEEKTIDDVSLIKEEKNQGANTLSPTKTCSKFNISSGSEQANIWLEHYTSSIITRLNNRISGFQFSATDILAMQELCGYETVIRGSSPFCQIFTSDEWLSFEYYFDIKYYYSFGYGSYLSASLGMPWVVASSELLNETVTTNQNLYINVVHREMLPLVLTALDLYNESNENPTLPLDRINYRRAWRSSQFVPFLGHIALERLQCTSSSYNGKFIRILVNSAPQPLPGCEKGPGASCPLTQFMDYIKNRDDLHDDFSKACQVNYQNSTDVFTFFP
ncbi:unnamed protein product [Adineta ricciae]|uniref:Uncharacterized protein n=1 Tax=Adineta ricciae TaxID=249248 RepID=A0A816EVL9_ADIRI|nr:unnamed protein product [Adineta ricciae]CAF1658228.1 unnamed protein product [Adineta ricciae]